MQTLVTTPKSSQRNVLVRYFAEVFGESPKALCASLDGDHRVHWIPRSQLQPGTEVQRDGDCGLLFVNEWFARTARLPQPQPQGESHHGI